jgi:hypothetical protein
MNLLRILYILPFFLLIACAHNTAVAPPTLPPSSPADHSITLSWTQSFADNFTCSSTVTTSCISGFQEGYVSGSTNVQQHTDTTAICNTTSGACTTTYSGTLPIASVTFYVVTTYVDASGIPGTTAATTTASPVQVAADAPTGLTATVQ